MRAATRRHGGTEAHPGRVPVERLPGRPRVAAIEPEATTSARSTSAPKTEVFSGTRALPKITAAPVGWATWSWSAYECIRAALDKGLIGEGIEGAGGLFGSVAPDGAIPVEEAGENPRSTRASAAATKIDWKGSIGAPR